MTLLQHRMFGRTARLIAGPAAGALVFGWMTRHGIAYPACATAWVACWMAVWWITEAVDLGITSFLPFVLFPLMGVMDASEVSVNYMEQVIFLFIGGFFIAYAMEKWKLHERIAYRIILFSGNSPARILLGIMLSAYILSMWVSNTATTLMLIAAVSSVAGNEKLFGGPNQKLSCALLLALPYAATIGGMGTLVGTPTNMIFVGFYENTYPGAAPVSFVRWFLFAMPFSLVLLAMLYIILRLLFIPGRINRPVDTSFIRTEHDNLGRMRYEERVVMIVFSATAVLWFTRSGMDLGFVRLSGWSAFFENGRYIKDSTVAVVAALALFLWPARAPGRMILEWNDVTRLPMRVIFLFGSGFALADAFEKSGLATLMASGMKVLEGLPVWVLLLAVAALITVLSEFASNVASIQLMLPVMAALAGSLGIEPMMLLVPATLAASFGFMMPVATAPNTIVFGTGRVKVSQMMLTGLFLNLVAIALLTLYTRWFRF